MENEELEPEQMEPVEPEPVEPEPEPIVISEKDYTENLQAIEQNQLDLFDHIEKAIPIPPEVSAEQMQAQQLEEDQAAENQAAINEQNAEQAENVSLLLEQQTLTNEKLDALITSNQTLTEAIETQSTDEGLLMLNETIIEGVWFVVLTIVLALAVKGFLEQILKW